MDKQVRDAITVAYTDGRTRDQIIIELVSREDIGLSLNAATKAYAEVAKEEGWTKALVSHKEAALEWLRENHTEHWDAEDVKGAVIELAAEFGVAESTARDYCKAYSEEMGVDHPTTDPRQAMFDWLVENAATATKAEFKEYAKGLGRSDSNINEYWKGLELHRAIIASQG